MKLADARCLRDKIREHAGYHCVVPLGYGPDGYFARIFSSGGNGMLVPVNFHARAEYRAHYAMRLREGRAVSRMFAKPPKRRSPIEIMVDRACGLEP